MPFEFGKTFNEFCDSFLKFPAVDKIARNPIYTALMITFIIMIIILIIFRDVESDESLLIMCLRAGFWTSLITMGLLFLHDKVLTVDNQYDTKNAAYDNVFTGSFDPTSTLFNDEVVPVRVNTDFTI
ncbi:hypothetical protein PV-S19_0185 [Pacmanvirus S19]|nr:hypothetical protein PV-S19_0185 [Pacmanvirus S19]